MTLGTAAIMLVCSAWAAGHLRAEPGTTGTVGRPSSAVGFTLQVSRLSHDVGLTEVTWPSWPYVAR
jgi:hypothetical protein